MKNLLKWVTRIVIAFVLLIVIAAFVLPMVIDPNDYKETIEDKIQANIGRGAHLNGEIEWTVFPWLALTFNDVTLDNEKSFKGKNMAEIQQLSAKVKLLPLLKKEIQIGEISIDDALINIQIAKNGSSNYQNILDAIDSDSGSDSKNANTKLNIAGIQLTNINLIYTDLQTSTLANISALALNTSEINETSPVDIDITMHINMPDTGLDVDLNTQVMGKNLLSDNGMFLTVNDLNISGKLNKDSHLPIDIQLQKTGTIDLNKDTLSFPKIVFSSGKLHVNSNLTGKNISSPKSTMEGSYTLETVDLNAFIKQLTGNPIVTTDVLSSFSSSGKWSLIGNRFMLKDLRIKFDETNINGNADIKNLDTLSGNFNVHIDKLAVDKFLGDEESAASSSKNTSSALNFGHLQGAIKIDHLIVSGTKIDNMKIQVNTNGSKMVLDPISADFYKGLLDTKVTVDTQAKTNRVIVEHKMDKIHAGPLITDLAGSELLTGIGNLEIDLKIDQPFSDIPLKTAHGKINYTLGDGAIYGVDVFGMMQQGLSLLYPEIKQETDDGIKKTNFALMQIEADINAGMLTTNTLKIESPYLLVGGDITIDLVKMTIKGTIEPMLLDIPNELVSDKYRKLLNLPIPVALSGSLLEPTIKIDAKKLLLATQKERIDKEKDKLKGKLLDSLFGKDKKKTDDNKN